MQFKLRFILLFCLIFSFKAGYSTIPDEGDLIRIKREMVTAVESSRVTDSLYSALIAKKKNDPLILGYIGTLEALKAKHSWNPYNKIKYVSMSQETLKKALILAPESLEVRFMRFCIQHYTPSFLGFSKELNEDRRLIISHYRHRSFGNADKELVKAIADFMINSERCTNEEQVILKKYA